MNANLGNINSKSNIPKGKANIVEFFPAKDLIFMEGDTELHQENMKIISDEIHYDLNEDRILKSLNSKIINNQ
jgi:lipopolysaccharide export system protein LptA